MVALPWSQGNINHTEPSNLAWGWRVTEDSLLVDERSGARGWGLLAAIWLCFAWIPRFTSHTWRTAPGEGHWWPPHCLLHTELKTSPLLLENSTQYLRNASQSPLWNNPISPSNSWAQEIVAVKQIPWEIPRTWLKGQASSFDGLCHLS